jgi:PBP1b-binding outer membrane lipoprotein LpoB
MKKLAVAAAFALAFALSGCIKEEPAPMQYWVNKGVEKPCEIDSKAKDSLAGPFASKDEAKAARDGIEACKKAPEAPAE